MSDKTWDPDEIVKLALPSDTPSRELSLSKALEEVISTDNKRDGILFILECEGRLPITDYDRAEEILQAVLISKEG
jgi:hypothetical protein